VIDPICDQLVDEFKNDGEADLVKAVTFEFPTRVTAALLGLPRKRSEMFRRLSLELISITEDIEAGLTRRLNWAPTSRARSTSGAAR
jgi:cytochrome P450